MIARVLAIAIFLVHTSHAAFQSKIMPLSHADIKAMQPSVWREDCPVGLDDLRKVEITFWGFDGKERQGRVVVHHELANEIVTIFRELHREHYPIERMQPIEAYAGDDELSMSENNTAAFNCRKITGTSNRFSQHAYGRAIDINPRINPYVKGTVVLPVNGSEFIDRHAEVPGLIHANTTIYKLFKARSWQWGGDWHDLKDYQHFEKRAVESSPRDASG